VLCRQIVALNRKYEHLQQRTDVAIQAQLREQFHGQPM